NEQGRQILRVAIMAGDERSVRLLMLPGASLADLEPPPGQRGDGPPDSFDVNRHVGRSPLIMLAVTRNKLELPRMVVSPGAKVNSGDDFMSPLGSAVLRGNTEMVALLLDAGADINGQPGSVTTPLMNAVHRNDPDMVRLLLQRGADPRAGDGRVMGIASVK